MYIPQSTDKCPQCNKAEGWSVRVAEIKKHYGAVSVVDKSIVLPHCRACGEWFIGSHELGVVEIRTAIAAVRDTGGTLTGEGFRAVRKVMGLTQMEFAKLVGYDTKETVCRWEKDASQIPARTTQLAVIPYLQAIARGALSPELIRYYVARDEVPSIAETNIVVTHEAA
jgi:DNA-binding transcriptional regulator YiaG